MDGQGLRQARKRLGMTQAELARRLDYAANYVAQMERGEVGPVPKAVELAVRFLLLTEKNTRRGSK